MVTFDHTARDVQGALSISEARCDQLDAIVMYSLINQTMMVRKLFDNPDDAPSNLRTKTGILERALEAAENDNERIYITWEYGRLDVRTDVDKKAQMALGGLAMLYDLVDGDEDKFISKFISHKQKAKEMRESGAFDEDDED